jgi:transcriptional regulator with XRE-family HTH domain
MSKQGGTIGENINAKIEAGATPNPTIETVKKIADALGVSLDDLMK